MNRAHLFNEVVGLVPLVLAAINRQAVLVKLERQTERVGLDAAVLEAALAELLGDVVKDLDIVGDSLGIVCWVDRNVSKGLAVDDILGLGIGQLRGGSERRS